MRLNSSKALLSCALLSGLLLSACSNSDKQQKDTTLTATTPATGEATTIAERNAQQRLIETLHKNFEAAGVHAKILEIKNTELSNLYWVKLDGLEPVYATADGKYIIQGQVIRLGDKELIEISESVKAEDNKALLSKLNTADLIVYPANGPAKHVVYIFTDVSCPYCHKLHQQIAHINSKGIEVRYIASPRADEFKAAMESVWCSKDRRAAFDKAIAGETLAAASCQNPVEAQTELGAQMGIKGTPAIYSSHGEYLGAYMSAEDLVKRLTP
ncbi:DsbC family protein [Acinetobacter larvae]|uniref:Thiol:disulfide interchange protein n=1 Tax=Acinetobacter larvae TaxID=1789224 RepID=A0A1B2M310_9GAMM|nr:DsbC family protein [Acinetobacter larvae]AOA59564.1 thiol:disulfide interchange protein [Acinetobacter larvae]